MISLLLVLLLLILLFLFHLLIMLKNTNVKTDLASENIDKGNLSLEHPLSRIRKKLKTLGLRRLTLKSLNRKGSISVIIMEQPVILDLIAISG